MSRSCFGPKEACFATAPGLATMASPSRSRSRGLGDIDTKLRHIEGRLRLLEKESAEDQQDLAKVKEQLANLNDLSGWSSWLYKLYHWLVATFCQAPRWKRELPSAPAADFLAGQGSYSSAEALPAESPPWPVDGSGMEILDP